MLAFFGQPTYGETRTWETVGRDVIMTARYMLYQLVDVFR
jgi:hypothetical protein